MTTERKLMILGSKSFDMDHYVTCKYDTVSIWYDVAGASCKIDIDHPKFKKTIPTSGSFALVELDTATTCISSILEEIVDRELAKEVLGCYSRFRISNQGQELNTRNRRRVKFA